MSSLISCDAVLNRSKILVPRGTSILLQFWVIICPKSAKIHKDRTKTASQLINELTSVCNRIALAMGSVCSYVLSWLLRGTKSQTTTTTTPPTDASARKDDYFPRARPSHPAWQNPEAAALMVFHRSSSLNKWDSISNRQFQESKE